MATIMRKMNIISRCEADYRTKRSREKLPGIFHSYTLAICKNPGLTQEKLARHLCINKSSVTRHLSWLEQNGYVTRQTSDRDKRELLVYPTEKMHNLLPEVVSITKEWNAALAADFSEEELSLFHRILDCMLDRSVKIVYGEEKCQ